MAGMFGWAVPQNTREVVLDYGTGGLCDNTRTTFRKWADELRGTDMKLAVLCRELEEAHVALMTYSKSVRNTP